MNTNFPIFLTDYNYVGGNYGKGVICLYSSSNTDKVEVGDVVILSDDDQLVGFAKVIEVNAMTSKGRDPDVIRVDVLMDTVVTYNNR